MSFQSLGFLVFLAAVALVGAGLALMSRNDLPEPRLLFRGAPIGDCGLAVRHDDILLVFILKLLKL